jgi:anti-sigma regulatory factor (Ser/Thr protein kinase)
LDDVGTTGTDPMTADTSGRLEDLPMGDPFRHPALFYSGDREFLDGTLSFVRDGLEAGDPVAVAVPGPNLELLRAALGQDATAVHMVDMREVGRNPGRIIPGVLAAFADAHPAAPRVWLVGEPIWPGRSRQEYPACVQHEALINLAFTGRRVSILCPYDVGALDPAVVADAKVTHPVVCRTGHAEPSQAFAPDDIFNTYNKPFPAPNPDSGAMTVLEFTRADLVRVRQAAAEQAAGHAMTRDRVESLEMVVNELAVNSVRHGGGAGTLRLWAEDGMFICEVADKGHLTDPLAGRRHVGLSVKGERGLLIAHYWSDLLRLHTTPAGTVIRAHFALAPVAPVPRGNPLMTP